MRAVGGEHDRGLGLIHDGVEASPCVCLATDGVDAAVRAASTGHFLEAIVDLHLIEVDGLRAPFGLGQSEPFRHTVEGNDPAGAEHPRTLDRKLPDRATTPHGDRITWFDLC